MERKIASSWEILESSIISCRQCPRLVAWREEIARVKRRAFLDWEYWGKPVPGFGDHAARLLILGLAPGAHGSNRTGRMFTGDSSGDTLFAALHRAGFVNKPIASSRDDGLVLNDTFITAVGRCAPPQNKPTSKELNACQPFLLREIDLLKNLKVVLALGKIAFDRYLRLVKQKGYLVPKASFKHGLWLDLGFDLPYLGVCYHPSRQNTQTGRLTEDMIDQIFTQIKVKLTE
jgi:uracil-DNA glycosylase family 4